ncbi:hypothetical protein [Microbulbifer taiwanensis]|uniref:hypothetical protein n=1 Tax=Microbulbifer taiwanensis TaxID=986746 RepID=UPI00360F1226
MAGIFGPGNFGQYLKKIDDAATGLRSPKQALIGGIAPCDGKAIEFSVNRP